MFQTLPASCGRLSECSDFIKKWIFHPKKGETTVKINKIYAYDLRNDAHFQFHTEFRNLVQSEGADNLKITAQFEAWLPLYEKEDTALKKITKSAITAQIQEADKARDDIYLGMVETNTAALRHFSEEVRSAAARLKIVFDTYGDVARKPLNEQTSAVYNILQELKGKYAPDTVSVGIGSWVSELEVRNNAFADLMRERFDETASRSDIVLKEARAEVDAAYFAIRERINALVVVEGVSAYENFIRTLNAVIAKYALLTKSRGGRGSKQNQQQQEASHE